MTEPERSLLLSRQEELMPGLPNWVVLDCVLPRIPWYARAILTATSKAWKRILQEPRIYSELSRRTHGSKSPKGLVMVHHLSAQATLEYHMKLNSRRRMPTPHAISVWEEGQDRHLFDNLPTWRILPPISAFAPLRILQDCGIACIDGKIFVMGGWEPCTDAIHADVYMLDIAGGLWEWEAMPPMHFARASFHCKTMGNKIYVVGGTSSPNVDNSGPEVFDVDARTWALLPRVSTSRSFHFNGLSLVRGGNLLLSHGFCASERGELIAFQHVYDPIAGVWSDYDCVDDVEDDTRSKCDDSHRDIVCKCDQANGFKVGECRVHSHAATPQFSGVIMSVMMM